MNIVETEMDAYEIAKNLFTNENFTSEHYTIHNSDLKNHFEMLKKLQLKLGLKRL